MKLSNKVIMLILGVVTLLIIAGLGFMTVRANNSFRKSARNLGIQGKKLNNIYKHVPFPTKENLDIEQKNISKVSQQFRNIQTTLRQQQLSSEMRSPAEFRLALRDVYGGLRDEARREGVKLPNEYSFGFGLYDEGMLPSPNFVPRLHVQLMLSEKIHGILFTNGVYEVRSCHREIFERSADDLASGAKKAGMSFNPQSGMVKKGDLYGTYRFELEFLANQATVAGVLSAISESDVFMEVYEFTLSATTPTMAAPEEEEKPAKPAKAAAKNSNMLEALRARAAGEEVEEEKPVVKKREYVAAQEEPARVTMVIDVYVFPENGGEAK